jgi:hypothetical protein
MITFSQIGDFGRLGNQLFQLAATLGIGRKLGYDVKFPKDFDVPRVFKLNSSILTDRQFVMGLPQIGEGGFHFDERLLNIPDNVDIAGYLQTEKYFKHIEDEIRELYTFDENIQMEADKLFPKLDAETVAIHVRRGDYVDNQLYHPLCTPEYYQAATSEFADKDYYFIIFSDDIKYCKELFGEQENILYLPNTDPFIDLCLMSMCDHNIIANSSFSWWAAWLNKNNNKRVIAPKQWFGPAYAYHIADDLYCKNWIIL